MNDEPKELERKNESLTADVEQDEFTERVGRAFDYSFDGTSEFRPYKVPGVLRQDDFQIGVIVGASGSGKTLLLQEFGEPKDLKWDNDKAIVSHFLSPEDAIEKLSAVGLNSIPTWCKPFNVLSTGEKFRADLARRLGNQTVIDEFTSVVDRDVAKSASVALSKYANRNDVEEIVLASCHKDIVPWLKPDWVIDTDAGLLYYDGDYFERPEIRIKIFPASYKAWPMFKKHHYLDQSINKAARCFVATWEGTIVGFASALAMPCGTIEEESWREHRTVVLPDFQGMGIGSALSNGVAEIFVSEGKRYFSRTAHPKFGKYREESDRWRATSKNRVLRNDVTNDDLFNDWLVDNERVCYSHEFIG